MKKLMIIAGAAALAACGGAEEADTAADETNMVVTEADATANAADTIATSQTLAGTTWQYTQNDRAMVQSFDENGGYITNYADGSHADHGTYAVRDGKGCFTSQMNEDGELCWTLSDVAIGGTAMTTSDDGQTLEVKRVAYQPLTMPS